MKKKNAAKLELKKSTIATLNSNDARHVAGGGKNTDAASCPYTCPGGATNATACVSRCNLSDCNISNQASCFNTCLNTCQC
jgi:hypothetical protein